MIDFEAQLPAMIALLKRLVETESPSHDKAAVDRLGKIVTEECRRLGAQVEIHPRRETGDIILAHFPPPPGDSSSRAPRAERSGAIPERAEGVPRAGRGEAGKGILLLAHMDTVFPIGTLSKMPFQEKDGKICGPGTSDMKGGIVVALTALTALRGTGKPPARPVAALFTSDEEIGSQTSRELIEVLARESALVLVLEPGLIDGAVKTWRKGVGEFVVKVRGRAAHAGGDHEKGRNAIEELAHQVIAIQKMTDYATGTTLNVGVIRGGTASNVVPEQAEAVVDMRVLRPGEAERIAEAMRSLRPALEGTFLEVTGGLNRPPMPYDANMKATFEKAKEIAAGVGIELKAHGTGGASDANFISPLGIPVLDGLGPAGEGYHSGGEYILANSLPERARLLAALMLNW